VSLDEQRFIDKHLLICVVVTGMWIVEAVFRVGWLILWRFFWVHSKMGVMSRRVVPVCGNLCCVCPSLRASSRQPVKRYKKLLADIFPRNQVTFSAHVMPFHLRYQDLLVTCYLQVS